VSINAHEGMLLLKQKRTPRILTDNDARIIAVLVGRPLDETWEGMSRDVAKKMLQAGKSIKQYTSRRGIYAAIHTGISYGGGQQVPKFETSRLNT